MIIIRHKRLKKIKSKNQNLIIITKITAICYVTIYTTSFITSYTGAYFNDSARSSGLIQAGTWENEQELWDKSSLSFINEKDQTVNSCGPGVISTIIKNGGSDMKGPSDFEVYYIIKGNPMKGEKVGEGIISPVGSGDTLKLTYEVSKSGNYKFRALQREGHGNKYDTRHDLWSETITVDCNTPAAEDEKPTNKENKEVIDKKIQQEPILKPKESEDKKETTPETISPVTQPEKGSEKVPVQETEQKVEETIKEETAEKQQVIQEKAKVETKPEIPDKQNVEIKQTKSEGTIEESENTLNKNGG